MAKQHVIEAETKQLLRRQQRHARLLRRAVALSLVALHACGHEIRRRTFTALGAGKNMVERQVFSMSMLTAVLAAVTVADVNACALHRRFAAIASNIDVMAQSDHRRNRKDCRRRMQNVVSILLFDENGAAKPQAHRAGDADGAERLIRKVQQ